MAISNYYMAIIIGLTLSLLIEIKFGVSPGGLIVPSYLSLVLDSPAILINIFLIAILTYVLLKYVVSKVVLIYGKRRFIACVMIALLLKFVLGLLFPLIPFSVFSFSGIGVVASGILANTFFRQGIALTSGAALLTSALVYGVMNFVYLF